MKRIGHEAEVKVIWWTVLFPPKKYYGWCPSCGKLGREWLSQDNARRQIEGHYTGDFSL